MTIRERLLAIKLMNDLEELYQNNSDRVTKSEDGTLNYLDEKGEVLIEAKMIKKS